MTMTAIDDTAVALAADVIGRVHEQGLTLAVAESLTGGELSATVVSVAGASNVFLGGVVSYAAETKVRVLGVNQEIIRDEGTVNPTVATQMAEGVCKTMGADIGVATTGVAGPGPNEGHPAGTVFLACSVKGQTAVWGKSFTGDRAQVRAQAVEAALRLLAEHLG